MSWLPYASGRRVFMGTPEGVRALDEETGSLVWQSDQRGFPLSVHEEAVYVRRLSDDRQSLVFDALEAATGRFLRTVFQSRSFGREVIHDDLLLGTTTEPRPAVCAVALADGRERWRWTVEEGLTVWGELGADSETVYVCTREAGVIALDPVTGDERWRHGLTDLAWSLATDRRPGLARGTPTAIGDRVIVDAYGGRIVGLSRLDGRRLWVHECGSETSQSVRHDGHYSTLTFSGDLVTLEPGDGQVVSQVNLDRKVPRPAVRISRPAMPLLLSESHVFTGSEEGYVLAFERPKGKYVWSLRPKGAATTAHDGNRFVAAGGRLFYSDMSLRLYALEEDAGATSSPTRGAGGRRRA